MEKELKKIRDLNHEYLYKMETFFCLRQTVRGKGETGDGAYLEVPGVL